MALMDLNGTVATVATGNTEPSEEQMTPVQAVAAEDAREALLAKKRETARRCNAKKKEKEAKNRERAAKLKSELISKGVFDTLSSESQLFLKSISTEQPSVKGGNAFFVQLFGTNPQVGDKITLKSAFNKTLKGKATIDLSVRRWADKGIKIRYNPNEQMLTESTYEIVELPQ